jgi:TusA-related sulfurtransferase
LSGPAAEPEELPRLDLRGVSCPLTFVKTKVALDRLPRGQRLEVLLDLGEPSESVPRTCRESGDEVLELGPWEEGAVRMVVVRPG